MFRNRTTSAKPSDELYQNFKANFPQFGQQGQDSSSANDHAATTSLTDALDVPLRHNDSQLGQSHEIKDSDPTPRGSNEPWNFGSSGLTPSVMDPNSHSFNMFANQMPGYYTPTPGGTNTLYHNQAGDLHTPNFGLGFGTGLGTPLSLPTSESTLHAGQQVNAFHGFHPHSLPAQFHPQQSFHNLNPFPIQHQQQQQQSFAPHQFTHQPSYDQGNDSPMGDLSLDLDMQHSHHQSPDMLMHPQSFGKAMPPPSLHPTGDKFRFHATLNAPTAMIKHADEIPVTYLNKGQAYTLNVVDTQNQQSMTSTKYRTFVRVSFEDEQQRQRPSACWQLWKEGRGTNEAHQRGGRLQAVEYVEATPMGGVEDPSKPRVELECSSFDGFCVTWTPSAGATECPISVRFNFLSTDFSHSKGVKGIPVRLCAKTEVVNEMSPTATQSPTAEVCYCKVKLFRDHGAERKLSNDVAHVKKSIDKLNQQITQIESGLRDPTKRKRSGSIAKPNMDQQRPGKVQKHRRTWSMSSAASNGVRGSAEDDLTCRLITLQDMFTSTRPASVLYLRGEDRDDPDLHPVKLTGEVNELVRTESIDTTAWDHTSGNDESLVSPTPSSKSLSLSGSRRDSNLQQPTPFGGPSRENSNEWRKHPQTATADLQPSNQPQQLASPPDIQPVKVQTRSPTSGTLSGWVEAVGIDQHYQPPAERAIKPVACFYVQPRVAGRPTSDNFYRAVYITNRSLKDLVNALATKCDIEPTTVLRTVRISRKGLHVLFDDECVRELPEGQDMTAEFSEISESHTKSSREWDATDMQCDGDLSTLHNQPSYGYELKLLY